MPKLNIYIKFALIAVCFLTAIITWIAWGFWYSFIFWIAGIVLLASYFLLGTIMSASEKLQIGDFDGAEKQLKLTFFPKLLYVSNRAFYHLINGTIKMNRKEVKDAEVDFETALAMDLPSQQEKAMVLLQLASINAQNNKWNKAENYYKELKELDVKEPMILQQIEQFDAAFKQRNQAKSAKRKAVMMGGQRGAMMRPGGKRRRPKMR